MKLELQNKRRCPSQLWQLNLPLMQLREKRTQLEKVRPLGYRFGIGKSEGSHCCFIAAASIPVGASSATAGSTRSGIRKEGARGTKRVREDDDAHNARRADMKLTVPEILKVLLVDDWEAVTKNHQLVTLPRSPTVREIFAQFEEHIKTTTTR